LAAGLCPNPVGELTALDSLAGFRGKGRDGREGQGGKDGKERGRMGKGGIGPPTFGLLPPPMVYDRCCVVRKVESIRP